MSDSNDSEEPNFHMVNDESEIICEGSTDKYYPDYTYSKRPNFFYTKITENRNKNYQCILCNFETNHLSSVRRHFKRHTNTRPFSCQNCECEAREKSALKVHTLYRCGKPKFTAEGEFKCHLCEYSSYQKIQLQRHLRCHTGYRPFACDQCEFRCIQKSTLKKHKLTHINREKSFPCEQCSRSYYSKDSRTHHVKTKQSKVCG